MTDITIPPEAGAGSMSETAERYMDRTGEPEKTNEQK